VTREAADKYLKKRLRASGMSWIKAEGIYLAVRAFGWSHW